MVFGHTSSFYGMSFDFIVTTLCFTLSDTLQLRADAYASIQFKQYTLLKYIMGTYLEFLTFVPNTTSNKIMSHATF